MIIEGNLRCELVMTDWTVVDETGGEVLALDMISGTGNALVRVQITNITIEFSVIRVSS